MTEKTLKFSEEISNYTAAELLVAEHRITVYILQELYTTEELLEQPVGETHQKMMSSFLCGDLIDDIFDMSCISSGLP